MADAGFWGVNRTHRFRTWRRGRSGWARDLPRQLARMPALRMEAHLLLLTVQRPSSLNLSGLIIDGRSSTHCGHSLLA